jgi:hypothetical protein
MEASVFSPKKWQTAEIPSSLNPKLRIVAGFKFWSPRAILRHSRIQTTLDIYTQGDGDETQRAAQGTFLKEMGMASEMIQ